MGSMAHHIYSSTMDPSWDMINNSGFRIISDHFGSPKDQIWDPNLILGCLEWDDLSCMDTSPFCSTTCQVPGNRSLSNSLVQRPGASLGKASLDSMGRHESLHRHPTCSIWKTYGKSHEKSKTSTFWDLGWTFEVFFCEQNHRQWRQKMVRWKLGETGRLFLQCWTVGVQKWSFSGLFLRTVFSESYSSKYFLFSKIVGWITLFGSFHLFWLLHSQGFWLQDTLCMIMSWSSGRPREWHSRAVGAPRISVSIAPWHGEPVGAQNFPRTLVVDFCDSWTPKLHNPVKRIHLLGSIKFIVKLIF